MTVATALVPSERMPKQVFYIPAFALLALIIFLQARRRRTENLSASSEAQAEA